MKAYYRTDKKGNVRWHAVNAADRPLCGVASGVDDNLKTVGGLTDVDCYRCRELLARKAPPPDLNSAMVVAPLEVAP